MKGRATLTPHRSTRDDRDRRCSVAAWCGRMRTLAVLLTVWVCGPTPAVHAESPTSPTIVDLKAGFDGHFKVGCWTPFEVVIQGGSEPARGHVQMTVVDGDGVPSRVHVPPGEPMAIAPGERVAVTLMAKIGQLQSEVTVDIRGERGTLATRQFETLSPGPLLHIMPSADQLVVTLGAPLASYDESYFDRRNIEVANLDSVGQLPTKWWALEGVDALIVATGDDRISEQLSIDSPQLAMLTQWVRMGGTLVMCVGRNAPKILAPNSPLERLAPGALESIVPRLPSTALETYAEASAPFEGPAGRFLLDVPKLADVRGQVQAYAGTGPRDLPLVVRTAHGFGEVVFAAFDLERPPLSTWSARPQLLDRLLDHSSRRPQETQDDTLGAVTTLGFVDMAGQLRAALDQFAEVRLVPFWLVAVLVVVYILCIGPLDYFLVKRVFRRMEATWISFTVAVIVFSAGAFFLAYRLKGREMHVNRVDLVDFDSETNFVRGTSWSNVFSPASAAYDLSINPMAAISDPSTPPRTLFSWMGLPGDGFGGMSAAAASMPLFTLAYEFSGPLDRLERVPIAVWSSKPFVGRWWADAAQPVEAELADEGRLAGTLTCNLDEPLEDTVLIYGRWAYRLRTLQPGQRIDIETQIDPVTVETYLRRAAVRGDRDIAPPYDRTSFDIPRIIEIMSFYELAGGESYTRLAHEYQDFVDLSQLVHNGRAILVGRRATVATQLICDGEPLEDPNGQHWTFVRCVLPVKQPASR